MTLQLAERGFLAPGATLAELAAAANGEHLLVLESVSHAIAHAIRAGDALHACKRLVPEGQWHRWMAAEFAGGSTNALRYMRIAKYKEIVVAEGLTTIKAADQYIAVATRASREERLEASEARRGAARTMHKHGSSVAEIAATFGVSTNTIYFWLAPVSKRRARMAKDQARHRAAMKAAQQKARERAVRQKGGDIAKAYSQLRLLAQTLERTLADEGDSEARGALRTALSRLYGVEDEIVRAAGVTKERAAA